MLIFYPLYLHNKASIRTATALCFLQDVRRPETVRIRSRPLKIAALSFSKEVKLECCNFFVPFLQAIKSKLGALINSCIVHLGDNLEYF